MKKEEMRLLVARVHALLTGAEPMTAQEVAQALGISVRSARAALRDLCICRSAATLGDKHRGAVRYTVPRGSTAPAVAQKGEQWRGTDWSTATLRPGCLDHERIPSRRGDERVPHMPPQVFVTGGRNGA